MHAEMGERLQAGWDIKGGTREIFPGSLHAVFHVWRL